MGGNSNDISRKNPAGLVGSAAPNRESSLALDYVAGLAALEQGYFERPRGLDLARRRTALVDTAVKRLFAVHLGEFAGICLVAIGGYGREDLCPSSDVDVMLLSAAAVGDDVKPALRAYLQSLWDAHVRVSHTVRTLDECGMLHEGNAEFTISILDQRPLAGDLALARQLAEAVLPKMIRRERLGLLRRLQELVQQRHAKFADTIFHLEPNVKDAPGGLRDASAIAWWRAIADSQEKLLPQEERLPEAYRRDVLAARDYLLTLRTFLHYANGRDVNVFSYDMQQRLATEAPWAGGRRPAEDWMREYFAHARVTQRRLRRMMDESAGRRNTLFRFFLQRKSDVATEDFAVTGGQVNFRNPRFVEHRPELLIEVFRFAAGKNLPLSDAAETTVRQALPALRSYFAGDGRAWEQLRQVLLSPRAYDALAAMHELRVLTALVPEFSAIDGLVIRDFYHRYTVDQHSLMAIRTVHELRNAGQDLLREFGELYREIERPEALLTALLLHDIGKGLSAVDHVTTGAAAADTALRRWRIDDSLREAVLFLISNHLLLSQALRRDVFDSANTAAVAATVGTEDRLKMLTIMTLADIQAVHPEALTTWKLENLWQLYMAVYNEITHGVERSRLGAAPNGAPEEDARQTAERLLQESGAAAGAGATDAAALAHFLDGLPRRYLAGHSHATILRHFALTHELGDNGVAVRLEPQRNSYELTVIAHDRPQLLATITGVLSAQGANILKAEAFANRDGLIVDTLRFTDLHRSFELNEGEAERVRLKVEQALREMPSLERLRRPAQRWFARAAGPDVATRVRFDDAPTAGAQTILEIVARDRPGLLFDICRVLADFGCDIGVALIDTEATKAIDVFYISRGHAPIGPEDQNTLGQRLREVL
jgi:[protein-PII] uridylyltransferase